MVRIWIGLVCGLCLGAGAGAQTVAEDLLAEARSLGRTGRHAEAIPLYERLVKEVEEREGEASWSLVYMLHELAIQHHSLGRTAEAEALYRRSLALGEQVRGARDPALVPSLRGLAAVAAMQENLPEAEALYRRALEIQEQGDGAGSGLARTLAELGLLCQLQERSADAEGLYRRALELGDAADLEDNEVATIAGNLAAIYVRRQLDDQAEPFYARALEIREGILGLDHPDLVPLLEELASLHERRYRFEQAASFYERILRLREQTAPNDLAVSEVLSRLAVTYRQLGRSREAGVHFDMARAILNAQCGGREPAPGCRKVTRTHQDLKLRPVVAEVPPEEPAPGAAVEIAKSQPPASPDPPSPPVPEVSESLAWPAPPASPDPAPQAIPSPAPPKPTTARVPAVRVHRAQVAARQDRGEAFGVLAGLRASHPDLLGDLPSGVVRADLGERGVWYRVRIGEFTSATRAKALCAELARRGHEGCWVIATESG